MPLYTIQVQNNAPGCSNSIYQQVSADTCSNYIVRITSSSNAIGPFSIFIDSFLYQSGYTRTEMINGIVIQLGPCVTPTPTPTPTVTPSSVTPTPTPTYTPTPSETPTNTPTPSFTPSPTGTPGATPTPTETPTPTQTNTETPTPTPTYTPTPSPTESIFVLQVLLQAGNTLLLQDLQPLLLQQQGVAFLVSAGSASCPTLPTTLTQTIYGLGTSWGDNITRFFTDINLTTPFNGSNLFYTNDSAGCGACYQIDSNGYTSNYGSPC